MRTTVFPDKIKVENDGDDDYPISITCKEEGSEAVVYLTKKQAQALKRDLRSMTENVT